MSAAAISRTDLRGAFYTAGCVSVGASLEENEDPQVARESRWLKLARLRLWYKTHCHQQR